jgi:hypothetical protein
MRPKLLIVVTAAALAAAACTQNPTGTGLDRARDPVLPETLLLGTDSGPLAVHVPTGSVLFERAGAVATPDGSLVFSTTSHGRSTTLETLDGATGEVVSDSKVPGDFRVSVASGSGDAVALTEPLPKGWDPETPLPRSRTTIVVADPSGAQAPRTYDLRGNYEPEAFSTDDNKLFLIQHLPAETPIVYRVTVLDLNIGFVRPVFGPYKSPPERMPGTRLQQVYAPDGGKLYTLYTSTRPGYAPHDAPVPSDAAVSFIHVLSLAEGWAHCVGLPKAMWDQPASAQALATSADGRSLYIVDSARGLVSVMDTATLEISAPHTIDLHRTNAPHTSAVVSSDGRTLFAGAGGATSTFVAVDTTTFQVTDRWSAAGDASGLGLSVDGLRLYVALEDRVEVFDPTTGGELGAVPLVSPGPVLEVSALGA